MTTVVGVIRRPSVLGIVGAVVRNVAGRVQAAETVRTVLDVGGLGAVTYGAYTWHHAIGWVVGGLSAMILSARLGT
jgi:hypothetical protein